MQTRRETWRTLDREVYDLLVIGGGITGTGIARDAALRGLRVALIEKDDLATGTSSKSSKLIHGGLRYLQQAEFGLVFESVNERTLLLGLAPHLVRPLEFLVPAYRGQYPPRTLLHCGLLLYDALAKFASPGPHHAYRKKALLEREPGLRSDRLTGGVTYFDSATDDARLTLENALDARRHGATIVTYARVVGFHSKRDGQSDIIEGVEVRDELNKEAETVVRARVTINATGPWSDLVLRLLDRDQPPPLLRPTKGTHVVLDAARLPVRHAVVMTAPQDGRVMFAIPWTDEDVPAASRTVLGTTDTDYHGDPDKLATDLSDVAYLLECANHYFPGAKLVPDDVLSTWAGLRPLVMPDTSGLSASQVSREHRILSQPGLITIVGGKLTTYRRMAAQVVEAAFAQLGKKAPPCKTGSQPLPGGVGLLPAEAGVDPLDSVRLSLSALAHPAIDAQVARHLAQLYGLRSLEIARNLQEGGDPTAAERLDRELPFLMAEVDLAVKEEAALRLDDVLVRRLPLLLRSRDQGLGCARQVAERMAKLLDWSAEETTAEVARYREVVKLSRQFRSGITS